MGEVNKTNNYTEFFYKAFRNILLVSVPLLVLSALILSSVSHSSADTTTVDNVFFDLQVSCTISSNVTSVHTAEINGGQHKTEVGETKVSTYCNDNNGYNIYAIGISNNIDGNTDLVVNGLSSDYDIKTGVYSSGDTVSSWSMKLTAGTGTGAGGADVTPPTINNGYNNYNVIPNVYTLVASRPSSTNMDMDANPDVTGSYFTTTYDIYASSVQPAGTYEGKVKYILTHPNTNAPNTVNDIDAAFALNGKQKVYQDQNGSYYAMQDMSNEICNSVTRTGEITTTQLVDIRDNKLYYVTKLKDGHCWMTQNLDLDIGGTGVAALTSENTDISTTASGSGIYNNTGGYTVDSNSVWTWTPANTAITANHTISGTSVSNWTNSSITPYSVEGGDVYYYTSNGSSNDIVFNSLAECATNGRTEAECKHYHRGNYYNWTAAIATNNSNGISDNYANAANSICPKNWRLPVATNSGQSIYEFGDLLYTYYGITKAKYNTSNITNGVEYANGGFVNIRKAPLRFVRSGLIYTGTLSNATARGFCWSSTVVGSSKAYGLGFDDSGVWPSGGYEEGFGWSVRCVAR